MSPERLNKALAAAGLASRRDCDEMIAAGRISVNGHIVHELGSRVDLDTDTVLVDGQPLQRVDERVYIMLHKPVGVVSTADDPQGRPTVVDMVPDAVRLFPVGRLDANSSGLLLLTNDGELAHNLTHPSFEVEKEYRVLLNEAPDSEALREWRHGVLLEGERTAPAWVDVQEQTDDGVWVRVVLREGRKRQIREVAKLLGYSVLQLSRVREGPLLLGDLAEGAWRELTPDEAHDLRTHTPPPPEQRSRGERMAARSDLRGLGAMGTAAGAAGIAAASQRERSAQQDDRPPRRDSRDGQR
ncbi:MAG: rRNA pseudouridine synthase, partial [Chloroflexaceae bacterium]|nr:rRNA pseudouridine synthase [Chloroflexaceae bacterium]